jgi:hypothetical protein
MLLSYTGTICQYAHACCDARCRVRVLAFLAVHFATMGEDALQWPINQGLGPTHPCLRH